MRTLICATATLLLSGGGCLAQISTMGTTAMAIPTTPGAIVSSPLAGPSPFTSLFSAATIPGAPATTLASAPAGTRPDASRNERELRANRGGAFAIRGERHVHKHQCFRKSNCGDECNGRHHRHVRAGRTDDKYKSVANLADGHARDHCGYGHRQHDGHGRTGTRTR
jgi:hypothetical protein